MKKLGIWTSGLGLYMQIVKCTPPLSRLMFASLPMFHIPDPVGCSGILRRTNLIICEWVHNCIQRIHSNTYCS